VERKIIHIDMDAYYASIEQRDNPLLKGKPVAVGGDGLRSVVAAASYEARKFGVHSAMPTVTAKKKCPELIVVPPRFHVYKTVSLELREVFYEYTDLVEPLSLDEAFLDVTENKKHISHATEIAKEIKQKIKETTGLTASAGVSVNKFLAKTATDFDKPDGLFVIKPRQAEEFVEKLPIEKFFGIGLVTAKKMHQMGIYDGKDLKTYSLTDLNRIFGKAGIFYYHIARAIDNRPVEPDRIRKSVGTEITFENNLYSLQSVLFELKNVENELLTRIEKSGEKGRTLTLKIKFADFEQITRSKSLSQCFTSDTIHTTSVELAAAIDFKNKEVRLLGLTLSNLDHLSEQNFQQTEIDFG
jgi:DNA polymerase-4